VEEGQVLTCEDGRERAIVLVDEDRLAPCDSLSLWWLHASV
jgi:hypothetical protein